MLRVIVVASYATTIEAAVGVFFVPKVGARDRMATLTVGQSVALSLPRRCSILFNQGHRLVSPLGKLLAVVKKVNGHESGLLWTNGYADSFYREFRRSGPGGSPLIRASCANPLDRRR